MFTFNVKKPIHAFASDPQKPRPQGAEGHRRQVSAGLQAHPTPQQQATVKTDNKKPPTQGWIA
jgi:hypothetical protein